MTGRAIMKLKCQANVIKPNTHADELELIMKTNMFCFFTIMIKDGVRSSRAMEGIDLRSGL